MTLEEWVVFFTPHVSVSPSLSTYTRGIFNKQNWAHILTLRCVCVWQQQKCKKRATFDATTTAAKKYERAL